MSEATAYCLEQSLHSGNEKSSVNASGESNEKYIEARATDSAAYYAEESLEIAESHHDKKGIVNACRQLASVSLSLKDTSRAGAYYQKALNTSEEAGNRLEMITDLCNLAALYGNDYIKSLSYYQQALEIARQPQYAKELPDIYLGMAKLAQSAVRYPEALGYYQQALSASKKSRNKASEANILFALSVFYNSLEDSAKAISYANRSLVLNRQLKNNKQVARSLGMLGAIYMNYNSYDKSLRYYTECIKILQKLNAKIGLASAYANMAFLYQCIPDYSNALKYHEMSLAISREQGYQSGEMLYFKDMASLIQAVPDSVLLSMGIAPGQRYKTAVDYGTHALELARALNDPVQEEYTWQILIPAYEKGGNYKEAYHSLKILNALSDSLSDQTKQKEILQKEVSFNFEQKVAAERAAREKEAGIQKTVRNALLAGLILLLVFTVIVLRQRNRTRKARERAEQSERQKQRFFTNISHEFRTPLTLLMGPLEDLIAGGDVEAFKAILPEMYRNSKRLLGLINQLLDLSRLDAGKYSINTSRIDIISFTEQLVHTFSSLAQAKNIELEINIDPSLRARLDEGNATCYFDGDILEDILINLLSNAFKFTPTAGHILVGLHLPERDPGFLALTVEDSGIGIPADLLPYIYDRFYQIEHGDTGVTGSGIGLSLIKELVELHGGKISVRSGEGKGTAFTCLLPLNKKIVSPLQKKATTAVKAVIPAVEEDQNENLPAMKPGGSKPVILVVDDQPDVRKYICMGLKDHYTTMEAEDGRQGLQMAIEHIPSIVITDVMMPVMDGFALCKAIKTDHLTSHIPVILLTARAEDSDKMAGLETGADAYLVKPFNTKELLLRVKNLMTLRNRMRAKFSGTLMVTPADVAVTPLDQVFIEKLLETIEAHMADSQFTVEALSKAVNMSTSQLNRKLKAITNQTPNQFIRSVRLQRALKMLKKEAGTVSEIAYKTGFETPSYFTKMFKAQFGCLPSEKEKFPKMPDML